MESTEYGYFWMLSGGTWWNLFTRVISSSCRRQVAPPDRQICGLGFNGSHLSVAGILEPLASHRRTGLQECARNDLIYVRL